MLAITNYKLFLFSQLDIFFNCDIPLFVNSFSEFKRFELSFEMKYRESKNVYSSWF